MGGTSFDVAVIKNGQAIISNETKVADLPVGVDALDIISIGAGGGSIAWVDSGGALRVGPQSAGATPGPASYANGGELPTVSDADLMLGYLDAENPLGGTLVLRRELAEDAIRVHVAEPLGLSVPAAAASIFAVVNHNMVEAIRLMSIARGNDPREFALVVGGGAGPVHGGRLAQVLGLKRAIIPREAGAFCAMGMIAADVRHDYVQVAVLKGDEAGVAELERLEGVYRDLENRATAELLSEGFHEGAITLQRFAEARYRNQFHDLVVPVVAGSITPESHDGFVASFHTAHEHAYTYALPGSAVDIVHARLAAFGHVDSPEPQGAELGDPDPSPAQTRERMVFFDARGDYEPTPVYNAEQLRPGMRIDHAAVVERATTTIVVFPDQELEVNAYGTFMLTSR
jgi:N-methylhydantoinase A